MNNLTPLSQAERDRIEKYKTIKRKGKAVAIPVLWLSIAGITFSFLFGETQYIEYFAVLLVISLAALLAITLFIDESYLTDYDFSSLDLEQLQNIENLKKECKDVEKYLTKVSRFNVPLTQFDYIAIEKIANREKRRELESKLLRGKSNG